MIREQRLTRESQRSYVYLICRMAVLLVLWAFFAIASCFTADVEEKKMMIVSMPDTTILKRISLPHNGVTIELMGPIIKTFTDKRLDKGSPAIDVRVEWRDSTLNKIFVRSNVWRVFLSSNDSEFQHVSGELKVNPSDTPYGFPDNEPISVEEWGLAVSVVSVENHSKLPVGLHMALSHHVEDTKTGAIYTFILVFTLYALIISDCIDRVFGSVIISIAALTLMACIGRKPSFETVTSWIDFGALMILLGSMIMVALMWETGLFDYVTLVAYRTAKGHAWCLVYILAMVSAFLATILDNATVVLLLAPAAIRLCEAAFINTKLVLIIVAIYANIGGSMTPVGSPANILIINAMASEGDINFSYFTAHMLPAAVISMLTVFALLFFCLGGRIYKVDAIQLARRRALKKPSQEILDRMEELKRKMLTEGRTWVKPVPNYFDILATVEANQSTMNPILLAHIGISILFIIAGFILRSMPNVIPSASFGWISMLAAFLLLILANKPNISPLLARIEWGVLIYVTSLFIITEVIVDLGFISWMGRLTTIAVTGAEYQHQAISSMLIILWMSAVVSAILDNTAVAAILMKVCIEVEHSEDTKVPLMSLAWALLLGSNYGGNGTMLGSLSNEFTAAVAKAHGYELTFLEFTYVGFPIMVVTLIVSSVNLLTADTIFDLGYSWT